MIYIFLYLIVFFLNIIYLKTKKNIYIKLIFIILTLFSGFRHNIGADFKSYERIFFYIENDISNYEVLRLEKGYLYLIELVNFINGKQQLVFLLMAIISNYFIYRFIIENSKDKFMSINIFFMIGAYYSSGFNGIRQYFAIAIFIYSIKYIKKKEMLKYFIFILIGSLFHKTCILLSSLYFILRQRYSFKSQVFILILSIFLNNNIDKILRLTGYDVYNERVFRANISFIVLFFLGILAIFIYILNINKNILDQVDININFLTILGVLLIFINELKKPEINQIFVRMISYFFFVYIYLITELLNNLVKKNQRVILKGIFLLIITILYLKTFLLELPSYNYNIELFK